MREAGPPRTSDTVAPLILIVDDNEDGRYVYDIGLRHFGYRVATAANGKEAIEKARALQPDLVVMDLTMPVMDGWEATRALKADPNLRTICIVALSGFPAERAEATALLAGCDRYMMKPCPPDELARVIQDVLQSKRAS